MKKSIVVFLISALVMASPSAFAAEKSALGMGTLAVKVERINFTKNEFQDWNADKEWFGAVEIYGTIARNWYVGAEVGYTKTSGSERDVDVDVTFVPVEVNLKYAIQVNPRFVIDFGAGPSYNYGKVKIDGPVVNENSSDWKFGGQAFVDLNVVFDRFFFGANGKYQVTQEYKDVAFDNWRIGAHLGLKF
jgi:hypothetical protein